jgi:DNA transformation protein
MAQENEFVAHVRDMLGPFGEGSETLRVRSMFGGFGVFLGDTMFALIADDVLYFKVDEQTLADFQDAGSQPFTYSRGGKPRQMSYYTAPDGALEHIEALHPWADRAVGAAKRNRKR